jgi:hypothetical protein
MKLVTETSSSCTGSLNMDRVLPSSAVSSHLDYILDTFGYNLGLAINHVSYKLVATGVSGVSAQDARSL